MINFNSSTLYFNELTIYHSRDLFCDSELPLRASQSACKTLIRLKSTNECPKILFLVLIYFLHQVLEERVLTFLLYSHSIAFINFVEF